MTPADRPPPEITFGAVVRGGWQRLKEMRTVFVLLVVVAAAALLGAVVPQNGDPQEYYTRYGHLVADLIVRLGLGHVHSAIWFLGLLGLLLLSLVACSGRLWQQARQRWRLPDPRAAAQALQSARLHGRADLPPDATVAAATAALRKRGYRVLGLTGGGDARVLYAHKHRLSAWGQALAHYSVFLIALGAVMGSIQGLSLDETVTLREGETLRSQDGPLPFDLAVDRFTIDRDRGSGAVSNYYSAVRLLSGGREVARANVSVNHPLRYRGYFISQVGWGLDAARVEVTRGGHTEQYSFPLQRIPGAAPDQPVWSVPDDAASLFLPGGRTALVVEGFCPDAQRQKGQVLVRSDEYPGTAALNLTYVWNLPDQLALSAVPPHRSLGWLLAGESAPFAEGTVKFAGLTQATGLGLRKDMGLPFVWAGFVIGMIGLVMIFYFPQQRRVLSFAPHAQGCAVAMAPYGRAGDLADDSAQLWREVLARVGGEGLASADTSQEETTRE